MRNFLLILFCGIIFFAAQTMDAQNPCPCDCDEIIYSPHSSPSGENKILLGKKLGSNCYEAFIQLRACGNRTLEGFSLLMPDPNCLEDKTIEITMDGEYIETVDLSNTTVPSFFQLDEPLLPCTTRDITFKICFPNNDDECLTEDYDIQVDYQTTGGEEPCPTQTVNMYFDRLMTPVGVAIERELSDLFHQNGGELTLNNKYNPGVISVYTIDGTNVINDLSNTLNTDNLKSGVYLIVVTNNNKNYQTKYILSK